MNNYSKMRRSNSKARAWLVEQGFKDIHFFLHTRFLKGAHIEDEEFDGMCVDNFRCKLILFQVKSNMKLPKKKAEKYRNLSKKYGIICLWLNIKDRKGIEINQIYKFIISENYKKIWQ